MEGGEGAMPPPPTDGDAGGGADARVPGMKSTYVPPSMRGMAGAGVAGAGLARMAAMPQYDDRDQSSLRVTNISEDTTEADLQLLFAPYGRIARIYLAKDRETMISRGFAFVSFVHKTDAQRALGSVSVGHFSSTRVEGQRSSG